MATESTDTTESFSGNRLQYGRLQRSQTATVNITYDEWLPKNIAAAITVCLTRSSCLPTR
ncbi:hypothetical protein SK236_13860 [Pseudomonas aeruginosa]|nr:hypothetical protein [Pseudomonas aeruginosa]